MPNRVLVGSLLLLSIGCAGAPGEVDAGALDAGEVVDAGATDAGEVVDAGTTDAGEIDAGAPDAGEIDAGAPDAGEVDAGATDAGEVDAGAPDAGEGDAGVTDAGVPDAGPPVFCNSSCLTPAGETCWSCWSSKPAVSAAAVIPLGTRILLDEDVSMGTLTLSGALITAPVPVTFRATGVDINGGSWTAGSSTTPHPAPLRIIMTGPAGAPPNPTRQILVRGGGTLELHGPVPSPVFTTLEPAAAGVTQFVASTPTDWRAGDEIIVTPSGHYAQEINPYSLVDAGRSSTEWFSLTAANGAVLTVDVPLAVSRYGVLDAGRPLDLRAQVANLTRGIVIEGADDATWSAGYGASVRVNGAKLVLDGVRLDRIGRRGEIEGAVQYHLLGDAGVAMISGSALTNSSVRALLINFSDNTTTRDSVIANVAGHGIWVYTGAETGNVIDHVLVTQVRRPPASPTTITESATLPPYSPSESGFCGASGFVLANPQNVVRNNVATDVVGCGFWYALANETRGVATGFDYAPNYASFGTFDNNLAHAIAGNGVHFGSGVSGNTGAEMPFDGLYEPRVDPQRSVSSPRVPWVARNNRVLGTQHAAFKVFATGSTWQFPVGWSSGNIMFFTRGPDVAFEDGLFVGSMNEVPAFQYSTFTMTQATYGLRATRTRFVNFPASTNSRSGGLFLTYGGYVPFGHLTPAFTQNEYVNVGLGTRGNTPSLQFDVVAPILDGEGIGGFPGRWWVENTPYFTQGNTCTSNGGTQTATYNPGMLCASSGYFGLDDLAVGTGSGTSISSAFAVLTREVTGFPTHQPTASMALPGAVVPLAIPANEQVRLSFTGHSITPRRVAFTAWGRPGLSTVVKIAYPAGTTFSVGAQNEYTPAIPPAPVTFTAAASVNEVATDPTATKFFFDGSFLYLRVLSDFRTSAVAMQQRVLVTATHPSLP